MTLLVLVSLVISDLYLFNFIVPLNPDFNCSRSLLSFSVDKVTSGTRTFASFILNVAFFRAFIAVIAWSASGAASLVALFAITPFSDEVKIKLISHLINGISGVLQQLLKCFNGTTI